MNNSELSKEMRRIKEELNRLERVKNSEFTRRDKLYTPQFSTDELQIEENTKKGRFIPEKQISGFWWYFLNFYFWITFIVGILFVIGLFLYILPYLDDIKEIINIAIQNKTQIMEWIQGI